MLRRARLRWLRITFLFIIPALALFFACGFVALLVTRPAAPPAPITETDIEATVQARVEAILSDQPRPDPAAPVQPAPAPDWLTRIAADLGDIVIALFGLVGLAAVGEAIAAAFLSIAGLLGGLGVIAQLLCCCLLPVALVAVASLLGNVFGD